SHGKLYAGNKVMNFVDGEMFLFGPEFAHCFYNDPSFTASGEIAHAIVIFFTEDFLGTDFLSKPELSRIRDLLHESKSGIKFNNTNARLKSYFSDIPTQKG